MSAMPCNAIPSATEAARHSGSGVCWGGMSLLLALLPVFAGVRLNAQTRSLDDFLRTAQVNNPLLGNRSFQLAALTLDSEEVRAAHGPQVGANGQFLYAPYGAHWGYDPAITNGGLYAAVLGASIPIFTAGRKQASLDSIAVLGSTVLNGTEGSLMELRQQVTDLYINTFSDQRALAEAAQRSVLLEAEDRVLTRLAGQGIYQQVDVVNLRVNAQAQRIAVRKAKALLRNDLLSLNALCGIVDTSLVTLAPLGLAAPVGFDPSTSPRLRQFTMDSIANAIADRQVDLNYRARLSAVGDAGLNAVAISGATDHFGASAGLNLSVPIYDGNRRRTQHGKIALFEKGRRAQQDFYAVQVRLRHEQLEQALGNADSLLAGTQRQYADEVKLIDLYRVELEHGLVRLTDLFLVLENHARTTADLIQAEAERSRIINALIHLQ